MSEKCVAIEECKGCEQKMLEYVVVSDCEVMCKECYEGSQDQKQFPDEPTFDELRERQIIEGMIPKNVEYHEYAE